MAEIFVYVDETGSCDYEESAGPRFGVGSATYVDDHRDAIWEGLRLRTLMETKEIELPQGFHAVNDSRRTRDEVFDLIKQCPPQFDFTYLTKANADPQVRARGKAHLYELGIREHLQHVIPSVSDAGDQVFVIAGTIHLFKSSLKATRAALASVCGPLSGNGRKITGCLWEARSSWGIQVADYCSWAVQREMNGKPCVWYTDVVANI